MKEENKQKWWRHLSQSLSTSRTNLSYQIQSVFVSTSLTDDDWERLEEILISADVGVETTTEIVDHMRTKVKEAKVHDPQDLMNLMRKELFRQIVRSDGAEGFDPTALPRPAVLLVVGVNGTGKTTTIAKLAKLLKEDDTSVLLVAADTFRAAAIEQLQHWAGDVGVEIIKHQRGADPAAVVYDAAQSMRARKHDFAIIDTAGRLQTYVNLMEELKKVKRVAEREMEARTKVITLLVMDATTGQNGISQAKLFNEALGIDGVILTKLDGTAKGGVVIAIQKQLGLPVVFVGTGEQIDDLAPFSPEEFAEALLE